MKVGALENCVHQILSLWAQCGSGPVTAPCRSCPDLPFPSWSLCLLICKMGIYCLVSLHSAWYLTSEMLAFVPNLEGPPPAATVSLTIKVRSLNITNPFLKLLGMPSWVHDLADFHEFNSVAFHSCAVLLFCFLKGLSHPK